MRRFFGNAAHSSASVRKGEVRERVSEARSHFAKALQVNRYNPYHHAYYGILLRQLGDDSGALKELLEAERLDSSVFLAYHNLGSLYMQMSKLQEAKKQLETAVEMNPSFSAAYNVLGALQWGRALSSAEI